MAVATRCFPTLLPLELSLKIFRNNLRLQIDETASAIQSDNHNISTILSIWPNALNPVKSMPLLRGSKEVDGELRMLCTRTDILVFRQLRPFNNICISPNAAALRETVKEVKDIVFDVQGLERRRHNTWPKLTGGEAWQAIKQAFVRFKKLEKVSIVVGCVAPGVWGHERDGRVVEVGLYVP